MAYKYGMHKGTRELPVISGGEVIVTPTSRRTAKNERKARRIQNEKKNRLVKKAQASTRRD